VERGSVAERGRVSGTLFFRKDAGAMGVRNPGAPKRKKRVPGTCEKIANGQGIDINY
jgi:hypothetical protein